MTDLDLSEPPFNARVAATPRAQACALVGEAMQRAGLLEVPGPPAALRWIETFLEAYGERIGTVADALPKTPARPEGLAITGCENRGSGGGNGKRGTSTVVAVGSRDCGAGARAPLMLSW